MYTLIHYSLCPFSRSLRLALGECRLEHELEEEKPWHWRPEFLELNPAGTLPVLTRASKRAKKRPAEASEAETERAQSPEAKHDLVLCGTYAITEYLSEDGADMVGDSRAFAFFPGDKGERAEVRRLVDWFHEKFDEEVTSYLLAEKVYRRFDRSAAGPPDMERMRAGHANLRYHLRYIGHLTEERNWLAGENLSFADLAAAAHLSCIDYLGDVPWDECEPAKTWYARLKSRPSFRTLLAERVPGLMPPESYADPDF